MTPLPPDIAAAGELTTARALAPICFSASSVQALSNPYAEGCTITLRVVPSRFCSRR